MRPACPSSLAYRHHQRVTVSVASLVTPKPVAEIVTVVSFDGGRFVETMNVLLVAPAGTVMLLGTEAILAELLERVTLRPPVGAGPLSVTVPVDSLPPFTVVGLRDSDNNGGSAAKVAVTLLAASIVTLQAPVPEQAPDQPPNCEPEAGVAVRDTTVPAAYVPLTGAGLAVIVPEPTVDRLRMNCGGFTVSVAVRVSSPRVAVMVTVVEVGTALVVTENVAVVLVEGTVTEAGTVAAAVLLLDSVTAAPSVALSVIVPVDVPTPSTMIGVRVSDANVTGGDGSAPVGIQAPPSVLFHTPVSVPA